MSELPISQLADQVGVPNSTVRYYERIGLMPDPARTSSGYRTYRDNDVARLTFIARGKRLGLSLEQVGDLLAVWERDSCGTTQQRLAEFLAAQRVEIAARVAEHQEFDGILAGIEAQLGQVAPSCCDADLECCVPSVRAR